MNKENFTDSHDFEAAQLEARHSDVEPVSSKLASDCLRNRVDPRICTSGDIGRCALAPECGFAIDKINGVSGHCLIKTAAIEDKFSAFSVEQ